MAPTYFVVKPFFTDDKNFVVTSPYIADDKKWLLRCAIVILQICLLSTAHRILPTLFRTSPTTNRTLPTTNRTSPTTTRTSPTTPLRIILISFMKTAVFSPKTY